MGIGNLHALGVKARLTDRRSSHSIRYPAPRSAVQTAARRFTEKSPRPVHSTFTAGSPPCFCSSVRVSKKSGWRMISSAMMRLARSTSES